MRNILVLFFCFTFHLTRAGGDPKYPVSAIPEELKKDANAVVREHQMVFTILAQSKAKVYCYYAITILNERGKKHAADVEYYDKLTKLTTFNGSVYDATGKLIRKLKNSEILDQSVFDGVSLFNDYRVKRASLEQNSYPYTVVFEYEKEYKFLYNIDWFTIVPDVKVSVQRASYELIFPHTLAPRYKVINIESEPKRRALDDGKESLLWTFENITPIKFEPMGNGWSGVIPMIKAAPGHFEFEGYVGDMQTWEEFGKWIASLNKGRDILPEATKRKIRELTSHLKTQEEKTQAVYEFLQNKSRYVSIQLGIGGFQPFEASLVDKTGYGDCKALSNYTVSLLAEAGVKAHYVLIRAGESETDLDASFPSSQFNHATVCVPNGGDTLWLECTSQTSPFAYAGTFTGDRKALAITENGAAIVRTPVYKAEQNVQSRSAQVFLEEDGNADAKVKTIYSGLQYENGGLSFILDNRFEDQKKWIQRNTNIPSFDINSFSITSKKSRIPSATVNVEFTLNRLATVSGKRVFLTPNLMNRSTFVPEKVEDRKTNVVRKTATTDLDVIEYNVPQNIYPEFLPESIKLKSIFGEYEASLKLDQGKVIYTRKLIMNKGEFPPGSYNELIDFYKKISKADNMKIVFLNKT